jgi:hypothetical protein
LTKRSHPESTPQPRISKTKERSPGADATRAAAAGERAPLLEPDYHEPWSLDKNGDLVNAVGEIIVDPMGCAMATAGSVKEMLALEASYLARIQACVNVLAGIPTADLERCMPPRRPRRF